MDIYSDGYVNISLRTYQGPENLYSFVFNITSAIPTLSTSLLTKAYITNMASKFEYSFIYQTMFEHGEYVFISNDTTNEIICKFPAEPVKDKLRELILLGDI